MVPAWVIEQQWKALDPPAEIRALGDQRSASNLLAATRALTVLEAKRYRPQTFPQRVTWCNIFAADACGILKAPLPHLFDPDGSGPLPEKEMRANDIAETLSKNGFPGWQLTGTVASSLAVSNAAAVGLVSVGVWRNPAGGPGHIVVVVPAPVNRTGVFVTGAGGRCVEECPIADAFGSKVQEVKFYTYHK